MPTYISLIRGINVGGHNMIPMAALKALHEELGFENVRTHLQSGNVLFTTKRAAAPKQLEKKIAGAIAKHADKEIAVIVRTPDELRDAIRRNPFPEWAERDPSHLVIVFLSDEPGSAAKKAIAEVTIEQLELLGRELYVNYGAGSGMGTSKLTNVLIEKKLGVRGTARNWNTINRLVEMAGE